MLEISPSKRVNEWHRSPKSGFTTHFASQIHNVSLLMELGAGYHCHSDNVSQKGVLACPGMARV